MASFIKALFLARLRNSIVRPFLLSLSFSLCATPTALAKTSPPLLQIPVACALGDDCWLAGYPDTDKATDIARDYQCGPITRENHDGSDFALPDLVTMQTGVPVRAAADGKILRLRDGDEDRMPTKEEINSLLKDKKACGNGMVIEHDGGWQTLYCHMKKNSFKVKEGQRVKAGDTLGLVGHSGAAEFPHLHFTVMKQGKIYDPFSTHIMGDTPCKTQTPSFWVAPPPYEPVILYAAGFRSAVPDLESLRIDTSTPATLRRGETRILTFWAALYGVAAGDHIELEIKDPTGTMIAQHTLTQGGAQARQFYYIGKDFSQGLNGAPPPAGIYTGIITLTRQSPDGKTLIRTRDATVTVQ